MKWFVNVWGIRFEFVVRFFVYFESRLFRFVAFSVVFCCYFRHFSTFLVVLTCRAPASRWQLRLIRSRATIARRRETRQKEKQTWTLARNVNADAMANARFHPVHVHGPIFTPTWKSHGNSGKMEKKRKDGTKELVSAHFDISDSVEMSRGNESFRNRNRKDIDTCLHKFASFCIVSQKRIKNESNQINQFNNETREWIEKDGEFKWDEIIKWEMMIIWCDHL